MKKLVALLLSCAIFITGCSSTDSTLDNVQTTASGTEQTVEETDNTASEGDADTLTYMTLDDPDLQRYIEDNVYSTLVESLDSEEYFVENVSAVYLSKEYIAELDYNSQSNVFFGFTLAELDEQFQGKKYVFDLGDDGQTVVHEFEEYDDTYDRVIKNVLIGTGVILLCVTVSVVSGGLGAPAISMIFAASAKTGTVMALSSGLMGSVCAGVATGIETGDFDETLKAAALEGSEAFKWGAIIGTVSGGVEEAAVIHSLRGVKLNGLTLEEAVKIQKESKLPLDILKKIHSMDEYNIYKKAGLKSLSINGKTALVQKIDLNYVDEMGRTNMQRILEHLSPLDKNGKPYELHHIGQSNNAPLAILTNEQHMKGGNNSILHWKTESDVEHGTSWQKTVHNFWMDYIKAIEGGLI